MSTHALAATEPSDPTDAPVEEQRRRPVWFWPAIFAGGIFGLALLRVITGAEDLTSSSLTGVAIALAAPIALAGLGGLWSERAGVVNIGLEGMMILGTWGAAFFGYHMGPWVGVLGGMALGILGGIIHAVATVNFGVDHIVSGVALNIIAAGTAAFLAKRFFTDLPGGGERTLNDVGTLPTISIPGIDGPLRSLEGQRIFFVSDAAGIIRGLTVDVSAFIYVAVILFVASFYILWRTAFGLRLRSCGESPVAAESLGVNVILYKFIAVTTSGALAGLGGAYLVLRVGSYTDGQTAGRGYIGLAAMIFGNWRPGGLLSGSLLFGYADAARLRGDSGPVTVHALILLVAIILLLIAAWMLRKGRRLQGTLAALAAMVIGMYYFMVDALPSQLLGATPYVTTLIVLAFAAQRLRMPAADGAIYRKGEGH
ncbi:MAG: ABC transporter permease [Actinomycetia bacterium]|nr:ABC transporter permease [Actinomycetes bacterium]